MCSEARGEEATAGTLQCRPSEIVAAPKVQKHVRSWLNTLMLLPQVKKKQTVISGVKHYDAFCNIHVKH